LPEGFGRPADAGTANSVYSSVYLFFRSLRKQVLKPSGIAISQVERTLITHSKRAISLVKLFIFVSILIVYLFHLSFQI
jgi:hypothetical protein